MQSARYYTLTTKFTLSIIQVRAAKDVSAKVDRSFFRLKTPEPHRAILALVKEIQGPQDVILELRMDVFQEWADHLIAENAFEHRQVKLPWQESILSLT